MKKLERLNKLHEISKLQEKDVLAELKNIQHKVNAIKMQIDDLYAHGRQSEENLINKNISPSQLNIVKAFNANIEIVLDQLNMELRDNNKLLHQAVDKIKEIRSRNQSMQRLTMRQVKQNENEKQKQEQRQLDENINFNMCSSEESHTEK